MKMEHNPEMQQFVEERVKGGPSHKLEPLYHTLTELEREPVHTQERKVLLC